MCKAWCCRFSTSRPFFVRYLVTFLVFAYKELGTLCIAITLFLIVVRHRTDVDRFHVAYHVLCWGVAGILTGLPFITDSYGDSGSWYVTSSSRMSLTPCLTRVVRHRCWIKGDEQGTIWRFVQFYLILWIVLLANMVLYLWIALEVRRSLRQLTHSTSGSTLLRLGLYPIILFVSYAFASANRIQNFIQPEHEIYWLFVLHTVFSSLVGLFNAMAYVATHVLRRETASLCRRACCCCCIDGDSLADQSESAPLLVESTDAVTSIVPINLNLGMPASPHWLSQASNETKSSTAS